MKHNFLTGLASALLLGGTLTGCSSDAVVNDEPQVLDRDTQLFIKVALADPGSSNTRADEPEYANGSADEMAIHSVMFVFYDANGNYINSQTLDKTKFSVAEGNGTGTFETTLKIIVPVDIKEGQGMPTSVMAYVNPTPVASETVNQAFDRALLLKRKLEYVVPSSIVPATETDKNHVGFSMTNSVYYKPAEAGNGPMIAAPIDSEAFFEDKTEAENDNDESKEITIYVERVAAKVTLTNTTDAFTSKRPTSADAKDGNNYVEIGDYILSFTPVAWAVNNLERETFLVKNFRSETTNGSEVTSITNMNYTTANSDANMGLLKNPSWNYDLPSSDSGIDQATNGRRTFWAYSLTYFNGGTYPQTADEYNNNYEDFSLFYLRYSTITANAGKGWSLGYNNGFSADKCIYTLENTMRPSVIADHMNRAMSSATIAGYYTLAKNNSEIKDADGNPVSFYVSRGDGKMENYKIWESGAMLDAFMEKNDVIRVNNGTADAPDYQTPTAADKADFEVIHPKAYGDAYLASRHVTLQLKASAVASGKYYYVNTNGVTVKITADNLRAANESLYSSLAVEFGVIEGFNQGKAYFNVPIKHLWAKPGDSFESVGLGEYGVVRNHAYNIEITGIEGLGTGVENPDDPIIPVVDKNQYYVKTKLQVQKWRLVPKQSVILK